MREQTVYLDSSSIVKRYVKEPGSSVVRELYLKTYVGDNVISYSIWNIGEVLGALDKARSIGRLTEEAYITARRRFVSETRRMVKLGIALVIPVKTKLLKESWRLLEKHHMYVADALQIASAKYIKVAEFLTAEKRVHEIASDEGLNSRWLT